MCGIAGIYQFNGKDIREEDLTRMRDSLAHRGPDGASNYISPDKHVGLGHRRLAIIDLSPTGAQPMRNEDGTVWITFNGEIYNYKSLREELIQKGYTFRSQSDTEVIIHGYEAYGTDFVTRLNGMFAFALWDEKKKVLFAARDHLGVKPFYYGVQNGAFYFGSEIKAILAHPNFKKECDEKNISYYLTFSCVPAPYTLFKDVKKLPPATYITVNTSGEITEKEYWNPLTSNTYSKTESEAYYIAKTREILEDSIKMQMVSDVPFGCFLSGGIDSSINAALMSKALGKPVETFSIGTNEFPKYNEFEYSRLMAERLGAHTHEEIVSHKDLVDFLPQYAFHADDPNGDQIDFMVFYLSKLIRKSGVIVAQVGEGADELFAGYPQYLRALRYEKSPLTHMPQFMQNIAHGAASALMPTSPLTEQARRLKDNQASFWGTAIAFSGAQKDALLSSSFKQRLADTDEYAIIKRYYDETKNKEPDADFIEQITYLELKIRLAEYLLMRVDKMGMAHSIEARVPFLDHRLVELALHIPQSLKMKDGNLKYILKQAAQDIVPLEIISRKKQGFGAPLEEWLRNKETAKPFIDVIHNSKLKSRNLFDYGQIDALINAHQSGKANNTFRIWNLVTLSLWYDRWF